MAGSIHAWSEGRTVALELELNGQRVFVHSGDKTPLLWMIRDELGLTGAKRIRAAIKLTATSAS